MDILLVRVNFCLLIKCIIFQYLVSQSPLMVLFFNGAPISFETVTYVSGWRVQEVVSNKP